MPLTSFAQMPTMPTDIKSFFDIYVRPSEGAHIDHESWEFRYAATALLVACGKADFDQDPAEEAAIVAILQATFHVSETTVRQLMKIADTHTDEDNLADFAGLVNDHYTDKDKQFLMENLWRVAYADGRLDKYEEQFIGRVSKMIHLPEDQMERARLAAQRPLD
jgi:uncharacterized tellurite resistance protein B-like protein